MNKFDANGNEQDVGINGFTVLQQNGTNIPIEIQDWREAEIGRIGEERFRREYGCEFLVYDETLINSIKLSTLESTAPKMNMGQTRWYDVPDGNENYIVALDPSMGTGGDFALHRYLKYPKVINKWQNGDIMKLHRSKLEY